MHEEQTADRAVSDSTPSIVQKTAKVDDSVKADSHDTSIQSPASTLADTLSLLSLSTPAAINHKSSRLGQTGQQKEDSGDHASSQTADSQVIEGPEPVASPWHDASGVAASKPAKAQEGDLSVGLIYDAIMEEHRGPPGDTCSHVPSLTDMVMCC